MSMKKNIGQIDKVARIVIGLALLAWGVMEKNWLGAIGLVPLVTALAGWCPLYSILGV